MSNVESPQVPSTSTKASKARRSIASDVVIARARQTCAALPPLLAGIAKADAGAAHVRIDQVWVTMFTKMIATAAQADGQSAVTTLAKKATTTVERQKGLELSLLLTSVRDRVATHNPDDLAAQQAFGRGEKIDPTRTNLLASIAGAYLAAWDGTWKSAAVDAGVTDATMTQIQSLRDALTSADVAQQQATATGKQGTVGRAAALAAVQQMTAFAVKVVANVYGKDSPQVASLSDSRPLTNRAATRKAATKAKKVVVAKAKAAKRTAKLAKPGARAKLAKGRAKRAAVAKGAKALMTPAAAPRAKKKVVTAAKKTKRAK